MLRRSPYPLLALLALIQCFLADAQPSTTQQQAIVMKRLIERNHFSPRLIDDSLSSDIFTQFIASLDPQQKFFSQDDFQKLSDYRYKLDDELRGGSWFFLELATQLYKQRLKRADSIINVVLQKPLDFTVDENAVFHNSRSISFSPTVTDLSKRWTKWFKLITLGEAYEANTNDSSSKKSLNDALVKLEPAIRQKIKIAESKDIRNMLEYPPGFENYVKDVYFNAVASCFDPHTMFFSPNEKENFQSQVSKEEFSFGFVIDETKEGKIVIDRLIPGGPAWKTGELNKNDELLQIQWDGRDAVDVSLMTAEETDNVLNQYNHGSITVKVKKPNGTVRSVTLAKEKIETDEDIVKGYILAGEKKIGYISLPDFYTTWDDENGSGCANDVAKEIVKLKKDNIDGLILDVRYNGGGSLGEALQLIGIFIEEGPLMGVKDRSGKVVFLKDPNRGTIFDGPMLVMVNGQSASASEALAAALQDYNRAVIVGSTTYGKATMQQIFPMDTLTSKKDIPSPNGYVKITSGKLYRVTGQTTQLNGVVPDIVMTDAYDGLEYRERFSPHILSSDTVKKNNYYKPLPGLPVAELRVASQKRIDDNKDFRAISAMVERQVADIKQGTQTIPLKAEAFEKWVKQKEAEQKVMNETEKQPSKIFRVENHQADKLLLKTDVDAKQLNEIRLKFLQQDIYVDEAYHILSDLIRIQKSKTN